MYSNNQYHCKYRMHANGIVGYGKCNLASIDIKDMVLECMQMAL